MIVIANSSAGSAPGSAEEHRARISRAFSAHGAQVQIVTPDRDNDIRAITRRAIADGVETIVRIRDGLNIDLAKGEPVGHLLEVALSVRQHAE